MKSVARYLLFPLTLIFGAIIRVRNLLYNTGFLTSHSTSFPTISVGNLAVGGTGKTPHVEYLIDVLERDYKVAVLSRGYKRNSTGFIIAGPDSGAFEIGDEPAQINKKFPDTIVAVDENRLNGIKALRKEFPDLDVIILDDAFQHRRISPGVNILVTDYSSPFTKDFLLPFGRLREHRLNKRRADFILVSRSPLQLPPIERRLMVSQFSLEAHQHLYFTSVVYKEPQPFNEEVLEALCLSKIEESKRSILLITGIANPDPIFEYLSVYSPNVVHMVFPDHHSFTQKDLKKILAEYSEMPSDNRCVITTEKDAERLKEFNNIASYFDRNLYVLPIGITFLNEDAEEFNNFIHSYVRKTRSNNIISE